MATGRDTARVRGARRTGAFPPDHEVRAAAVLQPDEEAHEAFRWLINDMKDKSAAHVVRQALVTLYHQRNPAAAAAARKRAALQGGQIAAS
ncbi:hypothetical protein ACIQU6_30660 [Streptomyces sp. NPDC090442]|uniref:hypothetical protein n=1 Tax=Streptomyces sp. NPDC090442 TaxID=3365962 RepID=UPI003822AC05